mgnify:FL=1
MSDRYMENGYRRYDDFARHPEGLELARAYIPYQEYTRSWSPEEALERGTMFPELYRPYSPHEDYRDRGKKRR